MPSLNECFLVRVVTDRYKPQFASSLIYCFDHCAKFWSLGRVAWHLVSVCLLTRECLYADQTQKNKCKCQAWFVQISKLSHTTSLPCPCPPSRFAGWLGVFMLNVLECVCPGPSIAFSP